MRAVAFADFGARAIEGEQVLCRMFSRRLRVR
jgi:hypothetical protein